MTIEEVKNYLNQAYYIDRRIDVLQNELSMLESKLEKCSPSYTTTRCGSPQPSFEYTIDRVIQYRDRLNIELNNLNNLIDVKYFRHKRYMSQTIIC